MSEDDINRTKRRFRRLTLVGVLFAVGLGGTTAYALGYLPRTDPFIVRHAQETAAAGLIDPDSARFRYVKVHYAPEGPRKGQKYICGEINGKNRNGAMVGFSRFIAGVGAREFYLEPTGTTSQEEANEKADACRREAKQAKAEPMFAASATFTCEQAEEAINSAYRMTRFNISYKAACVDN